MDDIKKTVTNLNVVKSEKKEFNWRDPLDLDGQLSEEEKLIRDTAYDYAQGSLLPRVEEAFLEENTDVKIFKEMGELGLLGVTISEKYGCAGGSYVSYGLVAREVERIDSGYRSMMSVQSSLVMHPINAFGSEEQKQKFLPKLASGDFIGCFGLTEPDAGSDPGGMKTTAKKVDGGYELSGSKMWISNSPKADIAVVDPEAIGSAVVPTLTTVDNPTKLTAPTVVVPLLKFSELNEFLKTLMSISSLFGSMGDILRLVLPSTVEPSISTIVVPTETTLFFSKVNVLSLFPITVLYSSLLL